jgi:hypothetical protein
VAGGRGQGPRLGETALKMSDIGDRLPDESRASNLDSLGHYLSHRPRFIHLLRTRRRPFRNAPHGSPSPLLPWLPTLKSAARERERFSSPVFPYIHLAWASTPRRSELERAGGSRGAASPPGAGGRAELGNALAPSPDSGEMASLPLTRPRPVRGAAHVPAALLISAIIHGN